MYRKFVAFLLLAAVWLPVPARAAEESYELPILMYHQVKHKNSGKDAIQPWELEADLQYLAEEGYTTVTMADILSYVDEGKPLPEKAVMLTFDDGYWNNYLYVLPLLKEYNAKIVLSVIGKDTDDFTQYHSTNVDHAKMTWDQIAEMAESGLVELQHHTYNLHDNTGFRVGCARGRGESDEDYIRVLTEDTLRLQEDIHRRTGHSPTTLTYPYGKSSPLTDSILAELGFRATLSCDYGVNRITRDPDCLWQLKRICRAHGHSAEELLPPALETVK